MSQQIISRFFALIAAADRFPGLQLIFGHRVDTISPLPWFENTDHVTKPNSLYDSGEGGLTQVNAWIQILLHHPPGE
jgi:hypothetical protein